MLYPKRSILGWFRDCFILGMGCGAFAAAGSVTTVGWESVEIPTAVAPMLAWQPTVVNDQFLATRLQLDGIGLVNRMTGAVTNLGGPILTYASAVKIGAVGAKVVLSYIAWDWNGHNQLILLPYDLETATWAAPVIQQVGSGGQFEFNQNFGPTVGAYRDEYRVVMPAGDVLRWRASDFSPLPPLAFPHPVGQPLAKTCVAAQIGEDFCIGITPDNRGVLMENEGTLRTVALPADTEALGVLATSTRYLVLKVAVSGQPRVLALDALKSAESPVPLPYPAGAADLSCSIWNGRFLVLPVADATLSSGGWKLEISDLENPADPPTEIQLPSGVAPQNGLITAGAFTKAGGKFWRLPLFPSDSLAGIRISDANAAESAGQLTFTVSADRPLSHDVTVSVRTVAGTARAGSDFVPLEKTITLTAANPSADVVVETVKSSAREIAESLLLEATDVQGAWRSRGYGVGIIQDSGFGAMVDVPALPGVSESGKFSDDWAMTDVGIVAKSSLNATEAGYFLLRFGAKSWVRVASLGLYKRSFDVRIEDVRGNVVCLVNRDGYRNYINWEPSLIIVNVDRDQAIESSLGQTSYGILGPAGSLAGRSGFWGNGYYKNFGNYEGKWDSSLYSVEGVVPRRFSDEFFMFTDRLRGKLVQRRFLDGSEGAYLGQDFNSSPLGPVTADGPFWLARVLDVNGNGIGDCLAGNDSGTGLPFVKVATGTALPTLDGEVTSEGIGFFPVSLSGGIYSSNIVDCHTGALLGNVGSKNIIGRHSWANGALAIETPGNHLSLLRLTQGVPSPSEVSFKRNESGNPRPWQLILSRGMDFPVTARVRSSSPDIKAAQPVVIPAGTTVVPFPAKVVDDSLPEAGENVVITLELSGDGLTQSFPIKVGIPANDFTYIEKPDPKGLIEASCIAVDSTGVMIGTEFERAAADVRYDKIYRPEEEYTPFFGRTVACNTDYVAIGVPFFSRYSARDHGNFVNVYKRKSGALHRHIDRSDRYYCAFGTVLRFEGDRLFVGAPGIDQTGFVTATSLVSDEELVFKQPKPAGINDGFGSAIASRGDSVWISAPRAGTGKVYQFSLKSGKLVRVLRPSANGYLNFGVSLELIGSKLAVGTPQKDGKSAVFLFSQSSGKLAEEIVSPFDDGGYFGASVAVLDGNVLVVGSPASRLSPAGALAFYHTSTGKAKLMNVLLPPKRGSGADQPQIFGGLGSVGGLSAAGNVLGIATGVVPDPISLFAGKKGAVGSRNPFYVAILGTVSSAAMPLTAARALIDPASRDAWERALGLGATAADCSISVARSGTTATVGLPAVPSLSPGARLVLETSENLAEWQPVASLSGGAPAQWTSSDAALVIDAASAKLEVADDSRARYFRIRCEVP